MLTLIRNFRADRARKAQEAVEAAAAARQAQEKAVQAKALQAQQAKDQAEAAERDAASSAERKKQDLIASTETEHIDLVEVSRQFARTDADAAVNSDMDLECLLSELKSRHQQGLKDLLPVERQNEGQLVAQFKEAQLALKATYASTQWPCIEMDFLQRRKWSKPLDCRVPLFAIFNVKSADFVIDVRWNQTQGLTKIADGFERYFQDILEMLEVQNRSRRQYHHYRNSSTITTSLKSQFQGLIPPPVRAKIQAAGPVFEDIYIVTESVEWKLNTVVTLDPRVDPLVVGRIKDRFWLIAVFDLTAAEDHARREYTMGSLSVKPN